MQRRPAMATSLGAVLALSMAGVVLPSSSASAATHFASDAPGVVVCNLNATISFSPPLSTAGGGSSPSTIKGKLSGCSVDDPSITITVTIKAGKLTGSFSRSPITCTGPSVGGASASVNVKWRGTVSGYSNGSTYGGNAHFPSSVITFGTETPATSSIGDLGFALPNGGSSSNLSGSFAGLSPHLSSATLYTADDASAISAACKAKHGIKHLALTGSISVGHSLTPDAPTSYTADNSNQYTLVPWVGRNLAVLTPQAGTFDPWIMTQIVDALDRAWDYYASVTGRQPTLYKQYNGVDTVAVVPADTCGGAACSYLGNTGNEILPPYFQTLYNGVESLDQYDQVLFYEFGRNFWFYGAPLAPSDTYGSTVTTGYAVFMRFQSIDAIGVQGGPFEGTPYSQFESQDWGIASTYDADLTKTFANTLEVGASPSVYGGTDFFASIVHLLATHYGGDCFIRTFLSDALSQPSASTDDAAVTNFVNAASQASGVDLGPFFYDYWAFPQSNGTVNARASGGIAALPGQPATGPCPA